MKEKKPSKTKASKPSKPSKDSKTKPSKTKASKPSKDSKTKPSKTKASKPSKPSKTKPSKTKASKPSKDSKTKPSKTRGKAKKLSFKESRLSDPLYGLKQFDIIEYVDINHDGRKSDPEIHLIMAPTFEVDPQRVSSYPTIRVTDGNCFSDTLHFFGEGSCECKILTKTHEFKMISFGGKSKITVRKKRAISRSECER